MKRLFVSAIGVLLMVGLMAAPASAAKGSAKVTAVKGTFSGNVSVVESCGYGWYTNFPMNGQPVTGRQPFYEYTYTATNLSVNGTTIGSGLMSFSTVMTPVQDLQAQPTWTFVANNGSSGLLSAQFQFQFGGMGGSPSASWFASQLTGTGKFAGVKGSSQLSTVSGFALNQPSQDQCILGSDPHPDYGEGQASTVTGSFGPVTTHVSNVLFTGFLYY